MSAFFVISKNIPALAARLGIIMVILSPREYYLTHYVRKHSRSLEWYPTSFQHLQDSLWSSCVPLPAFESKSG